MYWEVDGFDRKSPFYILSDYNTKTGLRLRDEYTHLACPKCGRVDTLTALRCGISKSVRLPRGLSDLVVSDDCLYVISGRCRRIIDKAAAGKVWYFELPGKPEQWIVYPKKVLHPPPTTKYYGPTQPPKRGDVFQIRRRKCTECGRFKEVTWRSEWFHVPAPIRIAMVVLSGPRYERNALIVDDKIQKALKRSHVTGWRSFPVGVAVHGSFRAKK